MSAELAADRIKSAEAAIGGPGQTDWDIDPIRHAGELEATAPELCRVLRLPSVETTAAQYRRADASAKQAQREFKRPAELAAWFVLGTVVCGAMLTIAGTLVATPSDSPAASTEGSSNRIFYAFSAGSIVFAGLAVIQLQRLRADDRLKRWMEQRAAAERRRLEYFDRVRTEGGREDPFLELLKLEYHRRFLLDSQLSYFEKRGREHEAAGRSSLNLSSMAMGAALIATGLAGFLATYDKRWAALAGVGIVASAFEAKLRSGEAIGQDRRNARRYFATLERLEDRRKRLDEVRGAVERGDNEVHDEFVGTIHRVLMDEHALWLESSSSRDAAIQQLDDQLKEHEALRSEDS